MTNEEQAYGHLKALLAEGKRMQPYPVMVNGRAVSVGLKIKPLERLLALLRRGLRQ